MVTKVAYSKDFKKQYKKLDTTLKNKIKKQIKKIFEDPEVGKPMKYVRKRTLELYIPPFRLSYIYEKKEDKVVILDFYHKDKQ